MFKKICYSASADAARACEKWRDSIVESDAAFINTFRDMSAVPSF